MIPAAFDYRKASSLEEAIAFLADAGDDAKLLAGGHSLIPLMRLRMATPPVLVDVGGLRELSYVREAGDDLVIGALTRHGDLAASDLAARFAPLLAHVAGQIGDPQVRHRGTIGGSLAHGDPASDLPAACLALGARFVCSGPEGTREVPAEGFFTGFLETALSASEVLVEVKVRKTDGAGWSFQKFNRRAQDWAIVGVAAVRDGSTRIGLVNMSDAPVRAAGAERAADGGASAKEAAALAAEGIDPPSDLNASAEYRRHLATVLVERALEECAGANR